GDPEKTGPLADDDIISASELPVAIENLDQDIGASTGDCLAALTTAGTENPFDGTAAPTVTASRAPAMHSPGDNEFVFGGSSGMNHMAPGWIVIPASLIGSDATITFMPATFMGHGNPLSMPVLELSIVTGGGGACTP